MTLTDSFSGFLEGASWPAPPGVAIPAPPQRVVRVSVPQPRDEQDQRLKPGDMFVVKLADGGKVYVKVPANAAPGQLVQFLAPDYNLMVASTLSSPPTGCRILLQRPIVIANVSYEDEELTEVHAPSQLVASMVKRAQHELLRQAHSAGCNAVLGIGFNVTTMSSADPLTMVSAFGTPCVIVREGGPVFTTTRPAEAVVKGPMQAEAEIVQDRSRGAEDVNIAMVDVVEEELAADPAKECPKSHNTSVAEVAKSDITNEALADAVEVVGAEALDGDDPALGVTAFAVGSASGTLCEIGPAFAPDYVATKPADAAGTGLAQVEAENIEGNAPAACDVGIDTLADVAATAKGDLVENEPAADPTNAVEELVTTGLPAEDVSQVEVEALEEVAEVMAMHAVDSTDRREVLN